MFRWLEPRGATSVLRVQADGLLWQGAEAAARVEVDPEQPDWGSALASLPPPTAQQVDVRVADSWCRWWVMALDEAADGIRRIDDLRALAAARLQQVYGLDTADWVVDCETPRLRQAFGREPLSLACCALPLPLLAALHEATRTQGWSLRSVVPVFADVCGRWLRAGGGQRAVDSGAEAGAGSAAAWLAAVHHEHAMLAVARQGRLLALHGQWLPTQPAQARAEALGLAVRQLAPTLDTAAPVRVWLCDEATPAGREWPLPAPA